MKVLVVGGTGFLGGAIARICAAAGDEVAVLSRRTTLEVGSPGLEILTGDRYGDLSVLSNRHFDVVYDTCAYAPDAVTRLLDGLGDRIGRYVFASSASVYGNYAQKGLTEEAPVALACREELDFAATVPLPDRAKAEVYGTAYGPLKRSCEAVAFERLAERVLILRLGLIVGAGDYTDRTTWWVRRIDQGGTVLVPGTPGRLIQMIDVEDAAAFARLGAVGPLTGAYNLTSRPFPVRTLFEEIRRVAGSDANWVWVDDQAVLSAGLMPWTEVPLWIPADNEAFRHFFEISVEKALGNGLCFRPLETTLGGILQWDRSRRAEPLKCGMSAEKEAALLRALT